MRQMQLMRLVLVLIDELMLLLEREQIMRGDTMGLLQPHQLTKKQYLLQSVS